MAFRAVSPTSPTGRMLDSSISPSLNRIEVNSYAGCLLLTLEAERGGISSRVRIARLDLCDFDIPPKLNGVKVIVCEAHSIHVGSAEERMSYRVQIAGYQVL